jgi:hypothetical protein
MRIRQIEYSTAPEAIRRAHDDHLSIARITNMKRTLLRSVPAFDALMIWYTPHLAAGTNQLERYGA